MSPSEPTPAPAPPRVETGRRLALDGAVVDLVADALSDATPRAATLALLRFDDYLARMRRIGLDVCPSGPLASALRAGLSRVCLAEARRLTTRRDALEDG